LLAMSSHYDLSFLLNDFLRFNILRSFLSIIGLLELKLDLDASIPVIVLNEVLEHGFLAVVAWVR
jgi:hypothetical protein